MRSCRSASFTRWCGQSAGSGAQLPPRCPQFTVYVAKAKWLNFAPLSVLLSSKACGTELMEHSEILGIFPTLCLSRGPSRVIIVVHLLLFRTAFAVCFQNMPGLYCSADIHFQTSLLHSLTFAILERDLYPRKKKKKHICLSRGRFFRRTTIL